MEYDEISPTMRAFIGNREMVRRLGFETDDIFFQLARSARHGGVLSGFLTIKRDSLEYNIECGAVAGPEEAATEYKRVVAAVNAREVSDGDYYRIFQECEAYQDTTGLVTSLRARGMKLRIDTPSKAHGWSS